MYAGAIFIQQAVGWNTYLSIAVILVITGIYSVVGKVEHGVQRRLISVVNFFVFLRFLFFA